MNNRNSVSAEAYGAFNKKQDFKPVVITKSNEATQKKYKRNSSLHLCSKILVKPN